MFFIAKIIFKVFCVLLVILMISRILNVAPFQLAGSSIVHAQSKSMVWERFDVAIMIQTDGTIDVVEHQTHHVTKGTFTFGYRTIAKQNLTAIDGWVLTDDVGHTYELRETGTDDYTFTVTENDEQYILYWYFPAIGPDISKQDSTAIDTRTFTLRYTVHDALRFYADGDQLWWTAIYQDRIFPVERGNVRVQLPRVAEIQQWDAYVNDSNAADVLAGTLMVEVMQRDRQEDMFPKNTSVEEIPDQTEQEIPQSVNFMLIEGLAGGEGFEVRVEFSPGIVNGVPQPWQIMADVEAEKQATTQQWRAFWGPIAGVGFGALGALFALGGPAILYLLWYRFGRDKPIKQLADYLPEPPDSLAPGIAGTLLDETVDMEDIIATLVDLAQAKAISITEIPSEIPPGRDFLFRRERGDVPLQEYEKTLLKALFGSHRVKSNNKKNAKHIRSEVRLSELENQFYAKIEDIQDEMYAAAVDKELFPESPERTRGIYLGFGFFLLVMAVVLGFLLNILYSDLTGLAVLPGVGLGITALTLMIVSRAMPRKTEHGAELANGWSAFKQYLLHIDEYTDLNKQKAIWDRWLPYAIAFGIEKEYIRKFEAIDAPAPAWYIPTLDKYDERHGYYEQPYRHNNGSISPIEEKLVSISTGLRLMLCSASSTLTSRPEPQHSGIGG
ncbi:MAG: DUF2207 domain-containing protein [Chloroflexota bacterium]